MSNPAKTPLEAALDWCDRGYHPVPIPLRAKGPTLNDWQHTRIDATSAAKYFNCTDQNIGVLDGDEYGSADADLDCLEAITAGSFFLPETKLIFGRQSKPRSHYFFRCDPPVPSKKYLDPTDGKTLCELRCLKSDGTVGMQTVVPPSIHESGEQVRFEPGRDQQPSNTEATVLQSAVAKVAASAILAKHWPAAGQGRHTCELALSGLLARGGWNVEDAHQFVIVTYISVPSHDRTKLDRVDAAVNNTFATFERDQPLTGWPTLAQHVGKEVAAKATEWLGIKLQSNYLWNDTGNADRLSDLNGDNLAHCEERNGYMVWTGQQWKFDSFVVSERMAEVTMRRAYADAAAIADAEDRDHFLKFVSKSLNKRGLDAMVQLAKKKVRQVQTTDFDRDHFSLNCKNGTVNLRTGELYKHRKEDLLSKMIPINYDPAARCPLFLRFIYRIMGDEPDAQRNEVERASRLVAYLRRLFGSAATAKPEKILVVCWGASGDNGKTTLLTTINKALGEKEYATQINIESLMVDPKGGGISNAVNSDLSDLQGCRYVFSSEVERGQRLALSRVKYLTGLTSIKTRRMRENWIEFPATWKIFLDCNERPLISSPTDAIWNRVKCIPFTVKIGPKEIDTDLATKLEAELPGILAWIVEGAREYTAEGLGEAPSEVAASTDEYRESSDRLKAFLEDCCYLNQYAWTASALLSGAYAQWCEKNGERHPLNSTDFTEQIKIKGCTAKKKEIKGEQVRGWNGIGLLADPPVQGRTGNPSLS